MANQQPFYHVFLSFRGPDTRNSFTCLLHNELERLKLKSFMDDENIAIGEKFPERIIEGIQKSMSGIIIFSENYASSAWCLRELTLILEHKKSNPDYILLPIYYHGAVPADVRYQLGKFGDALKAHKTWNKNEVEGWTNALIDVSTYSAEIVQGKITTFVNRVATRLKTDLEKLIALKPHSIPSSAKCPPDGKDKVLLYTKFGDSFNSKEEQDSLKLKKILEDENVDFEERNLKKFPRFKNEVTLPCPKLFINGKYVGGLEEVQSWNKNLLESVFLNFKVNEGNRYIPCGVDTVVIYMSDKKGASSQIVMDSQEVIKILTEQKIHFETRNAHGSANVKNELKILGTMFEYIKSHDGAFKYPIIFARGKHVGGLEKVKDLQKKGELKSTLLSIKK